MLRAGIIQLNGCDSPDVNINKLKYLINEAHSSGASFIVTPEVSNIVTFSKPLQDKLLKDERKDTTLKALRELTAELGIWLLIGSLALKPDDSERFVNRSFLISPSGAITARYDKIHMFNVRLSEKEAYFESFGYRAGDRAVLADTNIAKIGMTICYDIRFPHLYRELAKAGAQILTVPSAFTTVTGAAHFEPLLRARAIETGCFVIAACQTGDHSVSEGRPRSTYGHSTVVNPWGEVILEAGTEEGAYVVDLDLSEVETARQRIPSLKHDQDFKGPV